ncbi:MAG: efflux RND transporter permease subunit [Planctomycetota bacterium]
MRELASFGVRQPVPANLLMLVLLIGGIVTGWSLRREFFPEINPERAAISMPYPGANPEEIEQTLAIKVEDALAELDEVRELQTTINEGGASMSVRFREGIDIPAAVDEVERAVDALQDLPDEAEEIVVTELEERLPVIRVAVYGQADEAVLKSTIRGIRDDLRSLPGMGEIVFDGVRQYELRVDIDANALVKHDLSLTEANQLIGNFLEDVPGGTIRTDTGNIKVRTLGVEERAPAIREIVLQATPDGRTLRLGDIARVTEGFVDEQIIQRFNREPAAVLTVFKVGAQDIVKMAETVRAYVAARRGEPRPGGLLTPVLRPHVIEGYRLGLNSPNPLPPGVRVQDLSDLARFVEGRLDLLGRNAAAGLALVFATLLFFLNWRVAFWVGIGLATALAGTILLMWSLDITLNLLTMFGLIVVLGLLVDDAIVVAENIQAHHDNTGEPPKIAAVNGAKQVFWPVVATVMTSIVAFSPLSFIKGNIGDLMGALPLVVACALFMSLVESLLILPGHMSHSLKSRDDAKLGRISGLLRRFETARDRILHERVIPAYGRVLQRALRFRYISLAITVAVLTGSAGLVAGRWVPFVFLPTSDSETIIVELALPVGSSIDETLSAVRVVEAAADRQPEVTSITASVGQSTNVETGEVGGALPHTAQLFIELASVESRDRESGVVIDDIRRDIEPKLANLDSLSFSEIAAGPGGPDITIRMAGDNLAELEAAAFRVKDLLAEFEGVYAIADNSDDGELELRIVPRPAAAKAVGLDPNEVARQVRGFLFGLEAHVFAEREEDIEVRVRVDEPTRRSVHEMMNAWLVTPVGAGGGSGGTPVPIGEIVDVVEASTYATIRRIDRQRSVTVTADVAPGYSPEDVIASLTNTPRGSDELSLIDQVRAEFPTLRVFFGGRQEQMSDAFSTLPIGMAAALMMVYVILAWLFGSYIQPLIVMAVIPFALIGVIWGHLLLGYEMTFLSLIGMIALSGIVVNDSLILMEFYNARRRAGDTVFDALVVAGRARFRAIMLTTITTVLGLTPLILEQSFQAKFLIPMAIAIAGGLIATTFLILLVLPCLVMVFDDAQAAAYYLWHGRPRPAKPVHDEPGAELAVA